MGFKRGKLERCLFVHESNETRVVSHVDDPLICAKPATLEKFGTQITKLVVIKRGEALNPRIPGFYLGFEYRSVHDGERRGIHSETYCQVRGRMLGHCSIAACKSSNDAFDGTEELESARRDDNVRPSSTFIFRAAVGKLQYITGVRLDLMFATKCLSHKFASPTLADLTRAKKVLRYLKGTRELNLYLTIPALKPNDLNKTLKHVTGYSGADWASDPVTRKSTSCTLCYVDQFLLTS